jgi:hypothetical protein
VSSAGLVTTECQADAELNRREQVGKLLFFDESLSARGNHVAFLRTLSDGYTGRPLQ